MKHSFSFLESYIDFADTYEEPLSTEVLYAICEYMIAGQFSSEDPEVHEIMKIFKENFSV